LTRSEIDNLIDALDRADRAQTDVWRKPLAMLWERLKKAQRTRRWIGTPLLATVIALPGLVGVNQWEGWLMASGVLGTASFFAMQSILERLMPVLEREERIAVLQSYFNWRDYDDLEERTHEPA
jgi:hypothetical protein